MLINKILETYIDIKDPKEIYASDLNNMILEKLKLKFVGVCYMSCLIVKINKIIRRSYIYMKDTLDGDAHANVMFEVSAIIYQTNEIINGCKIIKKEPNGIIHGKSEHAGIQLSIQPNMSIFKENDIVPVIVKRVRYNVNQNAISVLAVPFIPIDSDIIYYRLTGALTKIQTDELKEIINQINNEQLKIKNLDLNAKKIYTFFNNLLSPIFKKLSDDITKKSKVKSIMNILDIKTGIIYKPKNNYDDMDIHYVSESLQSNMSSVLSKSIIDDQSIPINNIIDESIYIAFYSILITYLSNIQTLQTFIMHYPTLIDVQKKKDIWKMYNTLKK